MADQWQVTAGEAFQTALIDPAGIIGTLGARVEVPVTRAIVSYWRAATLDGGVYTVTLDGVARPGAYQLVWRTGDSDPPEFETFIPLIVVAPDLADTDAPVAFPVVDDDQVRPAVQDVALLERTRTVDTTGTDVGTFTQDTRPTDADVDGLIDQAVDDVLAQLHDRFDPAHYPQVKRVITLYTAVLIEGSFYREQSTDRGAPMWQSEYREALAQVQQRIEQDLEQLNLLGRMEPAVLAATRSLW